MISPLAGSEAIAQEKPYSGRIRVFSIRANIVSPMVGDGGGFADCNLQVK